MGGMGSGKDTVSQMRGLDVRKWKRDGYLEPGRSGTWTWSRRGEVVATINSTPPTRPRQNRRIGRLVAWRMVSTGDRLKWRS